MSKKDDASVDKAIPEETPSVPGQGDLSTIKKVDLSLHGDGISHWQDEPQKSGDADGKAQNKDRQ
jgi:hypothetical protein